MRDDGRISLSGVAQLEQPAPLRQQIYDTLENLIIQRVLRPGQRLVEAELALQLGISRNPVREALHALSANGWVDLRPRLGASVHLPTTAEVEDFFTVRTILEVETARLAALTAREGDVEPLRVVLHEGMAAVERGDQQALVEANSVFHRGVMALADNRFLMQFLEQLDKRLRWYFTPVAVVRAPESWQQHAEIVSALEAGKPERAAQVMRQHTEHTQNAYMLHAHEEWEART